MRTSLARFCSILLCFFVVSPAISQQKEENTNSIGMQLVSFPAGDSVKNGLLMGACEVTQAQYKWVMDDNPSWFKGRNKPVETVSWHEAVEFCRRLSATREERDAGRKYRLPTEKEWEYACRAGREKAHIALTPEQANYGSRGTVDVDTHKPNPWGLYGMHGNVREWCSDWYYEDPETSGAYRVTRGGNWVTKDPVTCQYDHRQPLGDRAKFYWAGFRVVCEKE